MIDLGHHPVVVIGGGLVGAALAWGMARTGVRPLILDESDASRRASRANFALVWVQGKGVGAPAYALWSLRSSQLWADFADDLGRASGIDVGFTRPGGLTFFLDAADRERCRADLERVARETDGAGAPFALLDAAATRALVPAVGDRVVGAALSPADGHVNSLRLFHALHAAVAAAGGSYCADRPVTAIEPDAAGVRVRGPWGEVRADRVVIAAGTGTTALAALVGLDVPLVRSKGQVIVTEKCRPFLAHPTAILRQTDEGGIMIGDSDSDDDRPAADLAVSATMARRALATFPHLASVGVVRTWAGFRVKPRDGLPVYDRSPTLPGVWTVACHSGVTLAAVHAVDVARRILDDRLGDDLAAFTTRRFACSAA